MGLGASRYPAHVLNIIFGRLTTVDCEIAARRVAITNRADPELVLICSTTSTSATRAAARLTVLRSSDTFQPPNDSLNSCQPVRNTALTYLKTSDNAAQQHILVGTQLGDVRRYPI